MKGDQCRRHGHCPQPHHYCIASATKKPGKGEHKQHNKKRRNNKERAVYISIRENLNNEREKRMTWTNKHHTKSINVKINKSEQTLSLTPHLKKKKNSNNALTYH